MIFFLFLHGNIFCGYSLEAPQCDISNEYHNICFYGKIRKYQGPVVQSVVSPMSLLRVILLTVLADSVHNILIFFAEKIECKSY